MRGCVFSVYPFPLWWLREYIHFVLLSSSNRNYELLPLFRVRSRNNGMRCMSFYILTQHGMMWILFTGENLRAVRFKSSYVLLKCPPPPPPPPPVPLSLVTSRICEIYISFLLVVCLLFFSGRYHWPMKWVKYMGIVDLYQTTTKCESCAYSSGCIYYNPTGKPYLSISSILTHFQTCFITNQKRLVTSRLSLKHLTDHNIIVCLLFYPI